MSKKFDIEQFNEDISKYDDYMAQCLDESRRREIEAINESRRLII